jgi:DNA-binding CsgD family transcriptional regulator
MEGRRGRPPHPGDVTPAEARVLELIREGLPNAEIAIRLGISINTVRYHVSNLLAKSGTKDREELRDWRPPRGAGGFGLLGYTAWLAKPGVWAGAVAATVALTIYGFVVYLHADTPIEATDEEQTEMQAVALVGELRDGPSGLVLVENGTGRECPVSQGLDLSRHVGKLVFLLGRSAGGEIRPTAGSVVGPLSQCSGTLTGTTDRYFISGGGCDGVELTGVSPTRLLSLQGELVTITVLPCTLTKDGRLIDPPMTLAGEGGAPSC